MTTNTTTTPDAGDIPAALRRTPTGVTPVAPPTTTERKVVSPAVEKAKATAKAIADKHNAAAKTATPKTEAKTTTPKTEAKAKAKAKTPAKTEAKATTPHKPSQVVRTEANPAKSIVPSKFKAIYAQNDDSCGDRVAAALKSAIEKPNAEGRPSLDMAELAKIAKANGIDFSKYAHLNNGQKRMNVGNRLRGLLKANKTVVIGKQRFADADKALAKPQAA